MVELLEVKGYWDSCGKWNAHQHFHDAAVRLVRTNVETRAAKLEQQALGELGLERVAGVVQHADVERAVRWVELGRLVATIPVSPNGRSPLSIAE